MAGNTIEAESRPKVSSSQTGHGEASLPTGMIPGDFGPTWDDVQDLDNPLHWSSKKKWTNIVLISFQATLTPIASTLLAVANVQLAKDFHLTDPYTPSLPVAFFILGNGLGPLYLAPLSELHGRRIVYIVSFSLFSIFNIGCALAPDIATLTILRLLSGMAGSAASTLSGASVADVFPPEERGKAQALYAAAPMFGPVIGGVIGGFVVANTHGWRWLMWIMVIAPGITVMLCVFFLQETYSPYLLRQKVKKIANSRGEPHLNTHLSGPKPSQLFAVAITRPLRLLLFSPICTVMSLYMSLMYAILYLHLVTLSLLFGQESVYGLFSYRWQNGTTGLSYLGVGTGSLFGTLICARYLNRSYIYMTARITGQTGINSRQPEARLPFMQLGMAIGPFGLIIFAWTAQEQVHWFVPLFGAAIFAVGMLMAYLCIQTYMVDAFEQYAASAIAGTVMLRSVVACVFSVIGFQLYKRLGYAWGTMLLAFLLITFMPTPLLLYRYGPRLRKSKKFEG